jgi:hypothetical protein
VARAERTASADWRVQVLAVITTVVLLSGVAGAIAKVQSPGGPPHPDRWDPRVAAIAGFVEKERGLRYTHPVYIDFLTPKEYTDASTGGSAKVSDSDIEAINQQEGVLRALGLAKGDLDLVAAFNTVRDSGTLAFYRSDDERVRVRGTDITPRMRVTLAHELTHALQDQHFDLDRLYATHGEQASSALRAVAEGDAVRIEKAYADKVLTEAERKTYDEQSNQEADSTKDALGGVPAAINASFAAPYFLGEPFVLTLANDGGNGAVNSAFRKPPTTDEHLMLPLTYLDGQTAEEVKPIKLGKADKVLETSEFGELAWYLTLGDRIDPRAALAAADGWAGDVEVTFERGGKVCEQAVFVGDESSDRDQMAAAIDQWVASMPGNAKRVERGAHIGFEACDPGTTADFPVAGRSLELLNLPTLRSVLIASAIGDAGREIAVCYSEAVLARLTNDELLDPEGKIFVDPRFQTLVDDASAACR